MPPATQELTKLSSESPSQVQRQVQSQELKWLKDLSLGLGLCFLYYHYSTTTHHPKLFRHFQWSYLQVLYLFRNLSWPQLKSKLRFKNFANFLQPYFANPPSEEEVQNLLLSRGSTLLLIWSQLSFKEKTKALSQIKSKSTEVFAWQSRLQSS